MTKKLILNIGIYSVVFAVSFGLGLLTSRKKVKKIKEQREVAELYSDMLEEINKNLREENSKLEEEVKKNKESK